MQHGPCVFGMFVGISPLASMRVALAPSTGSRSRSQHKCPMGSRTGYAKAAASAAFRGCIGQSMLPPWWHVGRVMRLRCGHARTTAHTPQCACRHTEWESPGSVTWIVRNRALSVASQVADGTMCDAFMGVPPFFATFGDGASAIRRRVAAAADFTTESRIASLSRTLQRPQPWRTPLMDRVPRAALSAVEVLSKEGVRKGYNAANLSLRLNSSAHVLTHRRSATARQPSLMFASSQSAIWRDPSRRDHLHRIMARAGAISRSAHLRDGEGGVLGERSTRRGSSLLVDRHAPQSDWCVEHMAGCPARHLCESCRAKYAAHRRDSLPEGWSTRGHLAVATCRVCRSLCPSIPSSSLGSDGNRARRRSSD